MSQHSGHSKGVRTSVPGSRARRQRGLLGTISHAPTPGTGGPPARLRTQRGPSRSARPSEHERQAPRARPRPRHRTPRPAVPPVPQRQLLSPHLGGRGGGGAAQAEPRCGRHSHFAEAFTVPRKAPDNAPPRLTLQMQKPSLREVKRPGPHAPRCTIHLTKSGFPFGAGFPKGAG